MSSAAIVASSLRTSLLRYGRSAGLWILLLIAPVAARFMIAPRGAASSIVSVDQRVPWLTSPMLGTAMGIVIATLLLPAAFIYLRANVNKRQPWQVEEPSPASRIDVAYGRWLADCAVLAAVLAATTAAACLLAVLLLPLNEVDLPSVVLPLWVIAAPALAMVASLRILFDATRWTRGWLGDVLFFVFWMGSLVMALAAQHATSFAGNMFDLPGFVSPMAYARGGDGNFAIGGGPIAPGSAPIVLDVMSGILAPGYLASRIGWLVIAGLVPLLAGLIYAPHVTGRTRRRPAWLKILEPGKAKPADPGAPPAGPARIFWLGVMLAEIRLIASGRPMMLAMAAVALLGLAAPWSGVVGPAAMLILVFTATAHAGRSEQAGLLALTRTGVVTPMARRAAFVAAGTTLMLAMGSVAIVRALAAGQTRPLVEALAVGAGTSLVAIALGAASRSSTAPRLLLLIVWYFYLNWSGGR